MNSLKGKKIILGITGSIAAYKAALLCRLLVKSGAEVRVIMTESATAFISPLTLATLSKKEVYTEIMEENTWNNHVELGLWADIFLIAPATANTLGKMCAGIADNILLATYLSARCPVMIAPAMDLDMYTHYTTKKNIDYLLGNRVHMIDSQYGELASGLYGKGRMAEPEDIIASLENHFYMPQDLVGKKFVITAGPTYERIDPVRYIGNHSTGKMGIEIATRAAELGADVNLILGPSKLKVTHPGIKVTEVFTAQEMYEEWKKHADDSDVMVFSAAVADYRPSEYSSQKIKKNDENLQIDLERTIDIAKEAGKSKKQHQFSIGFALETQNEMQNAKEKLQKKNFDAIVLNSLNKKGAGFGTETNVITIISQDGTFIEYEQKSKKDVAIDIINFYIKKITSNNNEN